MIELLGGMSPWIQFPAYYEPGKSGYENEWKEKMGTFLEIVNEIYCVYFEGIKQINAAWRV